MKRGLYSMPESFQRRILFPLRRLRELRPYRKQKRRHAKFAALPAEERRRWIFEQTRAAAVHAQRVNPFYRRLYAERNFDAGAIRDFEDLRKIPVVTKEMLRASGEEWRQPDRRSLSCNTGGTSGSPLKFLVDRGNGVREHYYMERIWSRLGCSRLHARAVFRGRNLGTAPWVYDPEGDAYFINTYRPLRETAEAVKHLFDSRLITYLHGYPSALYFFARQLEGMRYVALRESILRNLRGVLMGSEYPAPMYRDLIEQTFPVPTISWYGHSEMVVLAPEWQQRYLYEPFQSYGFCEAVETGNGDHHLVGTAYDNPYSPFIRYDTGDSIEPVGFQRGVLASFRIRHGRVGEYVLDRQGHPVSLTALIFGRHHEAFAHADFVQISQPSPGYAVLHVTTGEEVSKGTMLSRFDLQNVDITFDLRIRKKPAYSPSGKIPLLIDGGADKSGFES
ncbi:hypothetical protein [Kiritimatiella glycovorans]|uniref:Phenylacetate--CoA ligase family protein n=1 Tax=Kiritimatiella glycovorans TaxID=1307763 RepID=A0A0G3EN10_9BACT|nr:hypothetical protein [Kiritimatiella glycovorans]AKJ65524.1 hypothetical protein L21SP4_02297 [Kiritimatiella glycovorans]